MAEEADKQTPRKRRLRTNTETVRERTEKLQLQASGPQTPKRTSTFISGFTWPLRQVGKFFAKISRFLGRYRVFRIIGRILLPRYIRNSWRELRLVTWPNRRTSLRLTWAVIVFSLVFGLIAAFVDFILDKIFKELIIK